MGYTVHGILQARILEWVAPGDLLNPGTEPRSPGTLNAYRLLPQELVKCRSAFMTLLAILHHTSENSAWLWSSKLLAAKSQLPEP